MFNTQTRNLEGFVGQPFSRTFKLTSNGVAYKWEGEVKFVVEDANAQASLTLHTEVNNGFIEITTESLQALGSHATWYLTIGKEGPLMRGTFEFKKL